MNPANISPTERSNPAWENLSSMMAEDIVRLMFNEEAESLARLVEKSSEVARLAGMAAEVLESGGRIIYAGAGTSGRLAVMDAVECVPTFGTSPEIVLGIIAGGEEALTRAVEGAEDDSEAGRNAIDGLHVSSSDLVIGVSASGRARFVITAVERAGELDASTGWITSNPDHPPVDASVVLDTGPEVLAGSTRLKAATAAKVALNAVSTTAMVLSGRVRGNLMTSMRATNLKLRTRAVDILKKVANLGEDRAREILEKNDWNLPRSIEEAESR